MVNPPKFLVCENPMADQAMGDSRVYILHCQAPRLLAQVVDQSLEVIWTDKSDTDAKRLAGLMRRMGEWYAKYCEWENSAANIDRPEDFRKARRALNITQTQLAKHLGVSQSYVTQIETGQRRLSDDDMMRWVDALEDLA